MLLARRLARGACAKLGLTKCKSLQSLAVKSSQPKTALTVQNPVLKGHVRNREIAASKSSATYSGGLLRGVVIEYCNSSGHASVLAEDYYVYSSLPSRSLVRLVQCRRIGAFDKLSSRLEFDRSLKLFRAKQRKATSVPGKKPSNQITVTYEDKWAWLWG